jgi:hypothetical protein
MATATGSAYGEGSLSSSDEAVEFRIAGEAAGEGVLSADIPSPLELVFFTVTGFWWEVAGFPVVEPVNAIATFTPRLLAGQPLYVDDAAVQLGSLYAVIHQGTLCTATRGTPSPEHHLPLSGDILTPGFRLPANQFGLPQLVYDVTFKDGDGNQVLAPFAFAATDAAAVCITGDDLDVLAYQPPSQVQWTPAPPVTLTVVGGRNWSQAPNSWAS